MNETVAAEIESEEIPPYEDYILVETERHHNAMEDLRKRKPLYNLALKLAPMWCNNYQSYNGRSGDAMRSWGFTNAIGFSTIDCFALNLGLGSNDKIDDALPIFAAAAREIGARKENIVNTDCIEISWIGWRISSKYHPPFLIRAWFGASTVCQLKGTGKFNEVMEVVCD